MLEDPLQSMLLCLFLLLAEALLTGAEISIFSMSETRLEVLVAEGRRSAARIWQLQNEQPLKLQQLTHFSHVLNHALFGAIVMESWFMPFVTHLMSYSMPTALAILSALTLVILPATLLLYVLGYALPRRWALMNPEDMAMSLVRPFSVLVALTRPCEPIIDVLIYGVTRLLGDRAIDPIDEITEEEIKAFVAEHGSIAEDEKDLIHSVFEFGDVSVGELMIPRIDIEALEERSTLEEALALFRETNYSRLPIYQDTIDHIIGIVNLKDVLGANLDGKGSLPVTTCIYRALIVPEQKMALELLHEMQRSRLQMAIVTDEFGGTAGLVTMEDLIEQVVGEIRDETDSDEVDEISVISALEVKALGSTPVHTINSELGWRLPEDEDYDTIGGLVFSLLGRIPQEGDSVDIDGYTLHVEKMELRRIVLLHIIVQTAMSKEIAL